MRVFPFLHGPTMLYGHGPSSARVAGALLFLPVVNFVMGLEFFMDGLWRELCDLVAPWGDCYVTTV